MIPSAIPIFCTSESLSLYTITDKVVVERMIPPDIMGNIMEAGIRSERIITIKLTVPFATPPIVAIKNPQRRFFKSVFLSIINAQKKTARKVMKSAIIINSFLYAPRKDSCCAFCTVEQPPLPKKARITYKSHFPEILFSSLFFSKCFSKRIKNMEINRRRIPKSKRREKGSCQATHP